MIGWTRAVLRLAGAIVWLVVIVPVVVLAALVSVGDKGRLARNGARVHWLWSCVLCRIFGLRVRTEGPRPPGGAFVAANHLTHFDIPVMASRFPTQFVAKAEIARWPLFGWLALLAGTIYVDRSSRTETATVAEKLRRYLQHGASVVLFAEGTCGDGITIAPFKPSLFVAPAQLALPTVPVAIRYLGADAAWTEGSLASHMGRMLRARRIEVLVRYGLPIPAVPDRKALAAESRARVVEMFTAV